MVASCIDDWVYKALSLLVISCPCAFLISTPVGMVSAITSATRNGVLIKGSSYVEEMRDIKAVIFDIHFCCLSSSPALLSWNKKLVTLRLSARINFKEQ